MNIKPKHLEFCMNFLRTNDAGVAYKMTYPKAGMKSLYAAASRLMARPDVSAWIDDARDSMQERLLREIEATQVQAKKEQLLSINEKRNVLTRIITGEAKRSRHIKTKYGFTKVEDDQPVYAILRAIDMDTRLENFQNYLLHRDTWGKTPVLHINPPTLQQQVNILIAQSHIPGDKSQIPNPEEEIPKGEIPNEKFQIPIPEEGIPKGKIPKDKFQIPIYKEEIPKGEIPKDKFQIPTKIEAPLPGRGGGEVPLAQEKIASPPTEGLGVGILAPETGQAQALLLTKEEYPQGEEVTLAPEGEAETPLLFLGGENGSSALAEECHSGEVALAPDKPTPEKSDIFFPNPIYLTKLNKRACEFVNANKNLPQVNKNASLSPGEGRGEVKKRIFAPYLQPARE